jgi:hypothetical protein
MTHPRTRIHDRMAHDFHTFGLDGIGLNRVAERHAAEARRNEVAALRSGKTRQPLRYAIGGLLLMAGRYLEGKTVATPALPQSPDVKAGSAS